VVRVLPLRSLYVYVFLFFSYKKEPPARLRRAEGSFL
jgi:hypothetical protein